MVTTAPNRERRTAIIIGASRGLGLGLAREFARRGWQVTATARNASSAQELAAIFAASGEKIAVGQVDIDLPDSVESRRPHGGRPPLRPGLYQCWSCWPGASVRRCRHATGDWCADLHERRCADPDCTSASSTPKRWRYPCLHVLTDGLGRRKRFGGIELYRASKAALNSLTRSFVATDIRDRPIAVLTMHPGWVRTDMGGPNAPLSVAESVAGIADVIEAGQVPGHRFIDYQGAELAW